MAKDKEKQLFEDKAITFQRAVFIVCNLRRIIKRPKKSSDKCSSGATNRKKSGGEDSYERSSSGLLGSLGVGTDCEGAADSSGSGALKLRFRNPIRRAFTLPTIICGSFAGRTSGAVKGADDQEPDFQQEQRERDGLAADEPQAAPGEQAQPMRLQFWPDVEPTSRRSPGSLVAGGSPHSNSPSGATPTGASSAAMSRQASPVSFSGFQQCGRPVGAGRQLRPLGDNLSSLYCLATPIRMRAQRADRLEPAELANTASSIIATSARLGGLARGAVHTGYQRTADRHGNSALNQQAALAVPDGARQPVAPRQLWCPIWVLAMELLDASQTQPRDQSSHAHLLGAPSSQPFLLAPQEAGGGGADEQDSFTYLFDASSSGRHKHSERPVSNSDDSDREQAPRDRLKRHELINGRAAGLADAKATADSSQQSRMSMKRFSSSALCLNDPDYKTLGSSRRPAADRKRCQRPAIVLDEQHEQTAPLWTPKHQRANVHLQKGCHVNAKSKTRRESGGADSTANATGGESASPSLLLAPEDPLVQLARQRRPSASNQASINVDQQALFSAVECNQLERAKTIIDEAKVNVNSLNGDKLTCLDVAVLLRNADMVRLLQSYQAKESSAYLTREGRENQLYALYMEARRLVEDLSRSIEAMAPGEIDPNCPADQFHQSLGGQQPACDANQSAASGGGGEQQLMLATGSLLSSALFEEKQRQLQYWKRRLELTMQMRYGFAKLPVPNAPELAVLQVVGESSLGVKIVHSLQLSELLAHQQQQQQPQHQRQSIKSDNEYPAASDQQTITSPAEPLARLVSLARDLLLDCPLGPKCSHWLMDEFQALKHSDQMLNTSTGGHAQDLAPSSDFQPPLLAFERPSRSGGSRSQQASSNIDNSKQQERLAVFNYLLAQQLAILSNEQRQQQAQELLEQNSYFKLKRSQQLKQQQLDLNTKVTKPAHSRQPVLAHQIESTDSAYEHIMLASVRQQQQQQQVSMLAIHPTYSLQMTNSPPFNVNGSSRLLDTGGSQRRPSSSSKKQQEQRASKRQPVAYHSLAYQLMSARRHNTSNFCDPQANQVGQTRYGQAGALSALAGADINLSSATAAAAAAIAASSAAAETNKMIVITKYRVEWSHSEHFDPPLNSMIIYNTNSYPIECQINQLANGRPFYVRVSSGNQKGFSECRSTTPVCLAPSSWRQVAAGLCNGATGGGKRKLKYDEQVFKKFTKLILLNKHILEEHQINLLQREQHHLLTSGVRPTLGKSAAKRAGLQPASLQNKSSLINMLLLDATMPSIVSGRAPGEPLDFKPLQISAATHSPRGSLYPVDPAGGPDGELQQQAGLKVKKNFKNFFQSNSAKFHKLNNQNKRGLYLATVIYHNQSSSAGQSAKQQQEHKQLAYENKIVVTNDDRLPVIEIMNDLVSPSNLMADFYWLLKINGTKWIDIKRLRQQLQKSHSSSTLHLRIKLLNAIEQMQLALNLEDIGRLFYKPIQAHDGSIIISTCKQVASLKMVSNLSIKWTAQHKLIPRNLRKISDAISVQSSQQRELQKQQAAATFSTLMPTSANAKRHSSSATSGSSTATGSGRTDLELAPIGQEQQGALSKRQEQPSVAGVNLISSSSMVSSALAMNLGGEANGTANQQLGDPARLLVANAPELSRLCESCQQALIQRRCTMASASSSSSLASSESQSTWSSSQFSLSSQAPQQQQQQNQLSGSRSCTCSRSNSATIQVNSPASSSNTPTPTQGHSNQLSASNAAQSCGLAASAPSSQRNSSSARSSSGSVMMLMTPTHRHQSGGSLSAAPGTFAASGSSFSSASGQSASGGASINIGQRQTQSQHLCASSTQKSSTYLMLASLSPYDLLLFHLNEIIDFDQASVVPLKRGLYLGFVQLQTTVESMRLLVPRKRPNMIPCTRIRDNAHVSREEWQLLKEFGNLFGGPQTSSGHRDTCAARSRDAELAKLRQSSKSSSSRSSDPAIWSASTTSTAVEPNARPGQLQSDVSLLGGNLNSSSGGFDRDRAKSVSPGLMGAAQSAQLARDELLCVDLTEAAIAGGQRDEKMAHSDGDLQAVEVRRESSGELHQSDSSNLLQMSEPADSPQSPNASGQEQGQHDGKRRSSKAKRHSRIGAHQSPEMTFVRLIGDAAKRLLSELKSQLPKSFDHDTRSWRSLLASLNEEENNRVYHIELIELSNQVTFVLLIPMPENICPVTSHDKSDLLTTNNNSDYMLLPLQIFETIHLNTYEPDLLGKYSRLSTILETDLIVAQHDHRQAFSSNELKSTKSRVSRLQDMVGIADEFWRQLRWIVDVVSFARDKTQHSAGESQAGGASAAPGCLKVGLIWRHFDSLSSCNSAVALPELTATSAMEDPSPTSQRDTRARQLREEELDEEAIEHEDLVDSDEWGHARRGLEVKRTLSAHQRRQSRKTRTQAACGYSSATPIGAGHHYSSSGALNDCFGPAKAKPRPPRLPQIQLPSGEARDSTDSSSPSAEPSARPPGVKRLKNSARVSRLLSAGSVPRRPRQLAAESGPPLSVPVAAPGRRYSDQGSCKALGDAGGHNSSDVDANASLAHHYEPAQELGNETNNLLVQDEAETYFEESILNIEFDQCLRLRTFESGFEGGHSNRAMKLGEADGQSDVEAAAQEQEDVDEEAIYAYHISLRDATKRAGRRKSSS